ncbi:MAG: hypothetical protein J6V70_02815, partial [Kiritimatiellae bacterium]|nr:hypothetical protein [Kiritimatiellia bacterium]
YDSVYMLLDNYKLSTDEERRCLYVGMTRAKSRLVIHVNTNLFTSITSSDINYEFNTNDYPEPSEIAMQLGYRDVKLGFFKDKKNQILKLRSGQELIPSINTYGDVQLSLANGYGVCILSKACRDRVYKLFDKGYELASTKIDFIVAWRSEDDTEESAIILPRLYLSKH